ncbi:hypothetical protein NDU88_003377 [Pleurodeles waltl]|uniref:Myb-like domain-containing protein n=1 Tax=Pleurodeles waltl TaxID=8319 RepID=A0AAV7MS20_PLEWA|nr:hypothetical protein NDU88_003377 [Pleurodeles waltl]
MARVTGERAPAFTTAELERLVEGVSAHHKKGIWRAIAKDVRTLGVYGRRSKRWEDLRRWARKIAEAQLGMASQRGRGAHRTLTPPMACILVVAYPELDGRLSASQQPQGASSGGGEEAPVMEGAASHRAHEAETTDGECISGSEGEGSTMAETGGDSSDSDTSSDGSSLVVRDTSVPSPTTGTSATPCTSTAFPAAPQRVSRARSPRRVGISFAPGTSGPAPVSPAALSEEAFDLL